MNSDVSAAEPTHHTATNRSVSYEADFHGLIVSMTLDEQRQAVSLSIQPATATDDPHSFADAFKNVGSLREEVWIDPPMIFYSTTWQWGQDIEGFVSLLTQTAGRVLERAAELRSAASADHTVFDVVRSRLAERRAASHPVAPHDVVAEAIERLAVRRAVRTEQPFLAPELS